MTLVTLGKDQVFAYVLSLVCGQDKSQSVNLQVGIRYGICPKISYTKISDKMAYTDGADPDQTVP